MDVFDLFAKISLDTSGFEQGLNNAKSKFEGFAKTIKTVSSDISGVSSSIQKVYSNVGDLLTPAIDGFKTIEGVGKTAASGISKVMQGFAAAGTVVGGFSAAAVKTGAEFDAAMSQVGATMGFTVEELNDQTSEAYKIFQALRNAAIKSGSESAFSSIQSAEALNYMALAGYDAETAMAMLPKVLNLAAAGSIDLATASDMITDSQTALGLTLDQTSIMIDQMAKTSTKSNTSVAQLGEAILTVGGTAKYMAGGTAELNTVLGALADASIKGGEGGTKLRNILLALSSPGDKSAAVINKLGVEIFNADGKMRSFSEIFPELNASLSELTDQQRIDALATIFNSRDIAAVEALLGTTTDRWRELGDAILDAEGAAEKMAAVQLDNLEGDVILLKSAFEGLQIVISDALKPTLREFAQFGSKAINALREGFEGSGVSGFMSALSKIVTDGVTMLAEKAPYFANVSLTFIQSLADGVLAARSEIAMAAYEIFNLLTTEVGAWLSKNSGELIAAGNQIIAIVFSGFLDAGNMISDNIGQFIPLIARAFIDYHDALFLVGMDILGAIGQGIVDNKEAIQSMASQAIGEMVWAIHENAPDIIEGGLALLEALVGAIEENLPLIIETGMEIVGRLITGISTASPGVQAIIATAVLPHILKIVDTIGSIGTAAGSVVKLVGDAAKGIGGAIKGVLDIGGKLMGGVHSLFALLATNPVAQIVVGVAAVIAIFAALWNNCEGFRNFWIGLWEGLKEAVSGFGEWLGEKLSGIADFFVEAWNGVGEFFAGLWEGFTEAVSEFGDWFGGKIGEIVDWFKEKWDGIVEFFAGIWDGLTEAVSAFGNWISEKMGEIVQWIQEKWNGIVEFFAGVWDSIVQVFQGVGEFFSDIFGAAVDAVQGAWDGIVEFFSGVWEGIQSVWEDAVEFFTGLADGISHAFDAVVEFLGNVFRDAWADVESAWESAVEFFGGIWDGIQEVFATVAEVLGGVFSAAWEAIQAAWSGVVDFFSGVWEGIQSALSTVTEVLGGFFTSAWDAVQAAWGAATEFFGGIWDFIKEVGSEAIEAVQNAFETAWDAITSAWDGITEFFGGIWEGVKGVFKDAWDAFSDIGGNIVKGIWDGISGMAGWLWEKVSGFFGGIIDTAKSVLGIASPSKVFAGIGGNMALGLEKGWDDEYSDIKRQIEDGLNFGPKPFGPIAIGTYSTARNGHDGAEIAQNLTGGTTVNIYSPVAIDAVQAAREWKKTTQRIAMSYV